eukprot:6204089-Pleurochrysis_carterae.AAC.2
MYGWTMSYKWGHPIAALPVTSGTILRICKMTEIMQIDIDWRVICVVTGISPHLEAFGITSSGIPNWF